jgi:hypothetical protein
MEQFSHLNRELVHEIDESDCLLEVFKEVKEYGLI